MKRHEIALSLAILFFYPAVVRAEEFVLVDHSGKKVHLAHSETDLCQSKNIRKKFHCARNRQISIDTGGFQASKGPDATWPYSPERGINAFSAWQYGRDCGDGVVFIADTGVDFSNLWFRDRIWKNPKEIAGNGIDDDGNGFVDDVFGWNFQHPHYHPYDSNGHGTAVTSLIVSDVTGILSSCKFSPLKIMTNRGTTDLYTIIQSIAYVILTTDAHNLPFVVVNNSYGGDWPDDSVDVYLEMVRIAAKRNILFVVSAGNSSFDIGRRKYFPAGVTEPNFITVASTNSNRKISRFSNWNDELVHISAPGNWVPVIVNGGRLTLGQGTSFAAPIVVGSLLLYHGIYPDADPITVKNHLLKSGKRIRSHYQKTSTESIVDLKRMIECPHFLPDDHPGCEVKSCDIQRFSKEFRKAKRRGRSRSASFRRALYQSNCHRREVYVEKKKGKTRIGKRS